MKKFSEILKEKEKQKKQINTVNIEWQKHSNIIRQIGVHFEPKFVIDEFNKIAFKELLLYFTGNEEFSGDLNKGILLIGEIGTGKSLIFKIFKYYTMNIIRTNSFQMHSSIDIVDNVNTYGSEYLQQYSHNLDGSKPHPIRCYIDDLATVHEKIMHYGTEMNVIEQLISLRYNIFEKYGTLTHSSSNIYPSEMKDRYDMRIIDRMKEMFNIIELTGNSRRN